MIRAVCSVTAYVAAFSTAGAQTPSGASAPNRQASGEIRLIIQGDDMGAGHGINSGTIHAYKEGILRATNVLMPTPWVPEAARLLKENPGLDVGVHLTITSEWANIRWSPLSVVPSLVDENGYLFRFVQPRSYDQGASLAEHRPLAADVEKELRAQLEMAKRVIPQATYASTHMGFGMLSPDVAQIVKKLAAEYHLLTAGPGLGIQPLGGVWAPTDPGDVRARKLAAKLTGLGPGTWLMVDHAALDTDEIRAFGNNGSGVNVAVDRAGVVKAWTDPAVLDVVKKRGIRLTNYRELLAAQEPPTAK
ncbi:MAG: ChbG/HpnK family deacetylase [Bryobacteraceae bacterium]